MTDKAEHAMKNILISGMFTILLLVVGWVYAEGKEARAITVAAVAELQAGRITDLQRLATLEEAVRGLSRQLDRIEQGVDEVKTRVRR